MPVRKDTVSLICDIGELAGLFEKSTSLGDFLQTAVSIVAYHMRAAVCSVYLYDEKTQQLVLTATQGLSPDSVGKVTLKLGEGLVGIALKELRPIREGTASRNPLFKFIPGINEEKYQAFLAVPILRGLTRIGVLVVQDPVQDYFDENDAKALQAIGAQLSTVIENAKLLISIHQMQSEPVSESASGEQDLRFVRGTPASGGFCIGRPMILGDLDESFLTESHALSNCTLDDFRKALARTEQQLEELQRQMEERLADVASMIFSAHLLIVKDPKFSGEMVNLIQQGASPQVAIGKVLKHYIDIFSQSKNPRLREKVQDVKDLGRRLFRNLAGGTEDSVDYKGRILVAGEVLPSDILKLAAQRVEGLLMVSGGATSHVAILARSLQLPMVICDDRRLFDTPADAMLLIDGDQGNIYINPNEDVIASFRALAASRVEALAHAANMKDETFTKDGCRVSVLANINMISELQIARAMKAEGVGLYRSEFPFIIRNDFPSEEEQYRVYRKLLEIMETRPVVFRTLDVGGDKMLSYFPNVNEANPFLGLRAIRFSLRYRDIFTQQLRALLRAGVDARLRIMFPLISSVDDFVEAREVVHDCIKRLGEEKIPHNAKPELGVMIELPSAVEVADELAAEADFLSIGSNDLVQYVLAVDRTNEHISDLYLTHHPAVLRAMNRVSEAAQRHKKPLSLCGEMACDPKLLPFLLGIGIHQLSVDVRQMPMLQKTIGETSMAHARKRAMELLKIGRVSEMERALNIVP